MQLSPADIGGDDGMDLFRHLVGAAGSNAQAAWLYTTAWGNRRLHPRIRLVAITGSAGKTTTKALCHAVLSRFGECDSNMTSGNKRLPVARFVRGLRSCHRYAALEISGHKPGYLDLQMKIARPNVGVLTMIGRDHYSTFKGVEEIAREKSKIVSHLPRRRHCCAECRRPAGSRDRRDN